MRLLPWSARRSARQVAASLAASTLLATAVLVTATVAPTGPAHAALVQEPIFKRDTFGAQCYRIPAIVRTKAGTLLAFAEKRISGPGWCNDGGHIDLVMRRSFDSGRTWVPPVSQAPDVVLEGTDTDPSAAATRGNPTPIVDLTTGRIILLSTFNPGTTTRPRTPYVQYSDNDGAPGSWSTARSLAAEIDMPDWGWYATGPSHGIQLGRGAHAGRLVAGVNFSDGTNRNGAALVYSDDGGDTWRRGATDIRATTDLIPQELSLFERTDGGIYAAARNQNGATTPTRAYAVSRDGAATFEAPFAGVANLPTTPQVQGSTLRLRATDDGDRYNRVLFASPADPGARKKLTIWSSYNEGSTWTSAAPKQITADRSGYSDLTELATGEIGLLYEAGPDTTAGDARDEIRFARFTESDLGLPDDYSGVVSPDLSGANNDARLRGGATLAAGRFDDAVTLDGVDDHVHVPFAESLAIGASDFTATAWIRYGTSTADQAVLWAYNQGDFSQLWLRAEPGSNRIRGFIQSGSVSASVSSTNAYNDNAWHHVALQRAAGQLRLWVDGAVVASAAAPTGSISPGRPFKVYVGQRLDATQRFKGQLDEVRIYKRALSSSEIGDIRTRNAITASGAVLRLPFTANSPTTPDTSGAGNVGLVRGGATLTAGKFGSALAFDGVDDHVHVPFSGSLDLGSGDFTVAAWLRYAGGPNRHTMLWGYDYGTATGQIWLRAHPAENRLMGWVESSTASGWAQSPAAYGDSGWHHVAVQRTATQVLLWVDGVRVGTGTAPAGSVTAGHPTDILGLYVGQRPDGVDRLAGALDEVRVFTRALTADELNRLYLSNASITDGLVLRLPFDRTDPA
ncbi:sialidase family protein [Plantactinospora mayteni]|nr:sialidase family protein [Plantactinospora mayteni]